MKKKIIISWFFIALISIGLIACWQSNNSNGAEKQSPYMNMADSAQYVGMETCKTCHENIYETFIQTGMGQSIGLAKRSKSAADFSKNHTIYDSISGFFYTAYFEDDSLYIEEYEKDKDNNKTHFYKQAISYIIGSGQHTNSHLWQHNGYLYQAPLSFYTQEKIWDLAPGFEAGHNTRFRRIITDECMSCHNAYPSLVEGSENKYISIKSGIDCERCHGPGSVHVNQKKAGIIVDTTKSNYDFSIVNPKGLPREEQIDVCQRCHLQGITVLNPNKNYHSFKPGMRLKDVMNVYMPRYTDSDQHFIMASHADRMKQSPCYNKSEMTCLSCHNPHISVKQTPVETWDKKCNSCHQEKPCLLPKTKQENNTCISCHMPMTKSIDIPHIKIHDHFIRIHKGEIKNKTRQFIDLACTTQDKSDVLKKGIAYLNFYEEYTPEKAFLDSALVYIQLHKTKDNEYYQALQRYYYLMKDYKTMCELGNKYQANQGYDAWTLYRLSKAYYETQDYTSALKYINKALQKMPLQLDFINHKGNTQIQLKLYSDAIATYTTSIQEQYYQAEAHGNLGFAESTLGNYDKALQHISIALTINPLYERAIVNKASILMQQNKKGEARLLLEKASLRQPNNMTLKKKWEESKRM